jgi:hypothetical protein
VEPGQFADHQGRADFTGELREPERPENVAVSCPNAKGAGDQPPAEGEESEGRQENAQHGRAVDRIEATKDGKQAAGVEASDQGCEQ